MTLQPVAHAMTPRPKQATMLRDVCIYAHAGVPLTGTLTPLLHLTTSHEFCAPDGACLADAVDAVDDMEIVTRLDAQSG